MSRSDYSDHLYVAVVAPEDQAEWAVAVLWEHGVEGVEERRLPGAVELLAALPTQRWEALSAALEPAWRAEQRPWPTSATTWRTTAEPWTVSGITYALPEARATPDAHTVIIEPGDAFGAGTHPSTTLAVRLLSRLAGSGRAERCVLDVGTGTGVLALACLRMGATTAVGVDLDAGAVEVARRNMARNGLAGRATVLHGSVDHAPARRYDVVMANVLLPAHVDLSERIAAIAPAATLVLSGLLDRQVPLVEDRYRAWARVDTASERGWTAITLVPDRRPRHASEAATGDAAGEVRSGGVDE